MKKPLFFFWVYIYPFPALYFFYQYWAQKCNPSFAQFIIIVPILYGYIIPGTAVNIMKKWHFNTKFRLGRYYAHHGFKYAANMNTWFFITSFHADLTKLSIWQALTFALSAGMTHAFVTWWHDTNLMKLGKLELYNSLVTPGMSPEEKTYTYAPFTFLSLGFSFALCNIYYYNQYLSGQEQNQPLNIVIGFLFISTISSLAFGWLEYLGKAKKSAR